MITGANFCKRLLRDAGIEACVVSGPENAYVPGEQLIVLRPHCHGGTTVRQLTLAAHEVGHAAQHATIGWLAPALRWLLPGRLWLEWDASQRARQMMGAQERVACEEALAESWRGYLVPAIWQVAAMMGVLIFAVMRRG